MRFHLSAAALAAVAPGALHAAEQAGAAAGPSLWSSGGQLVLALLAVVGLIYATGWLVRRVGVPGQGSAELKVLGGVAVGARERLVVVQWGQQKLLLGVTAQQITALSARDLAPGEFAAAIGRELEKDGGS